MENTLSGVHAPRSTLQSLLSQHPNGQRSCRESVDTATQQYGLVDRLDSEDDRCLPLSRCKRSVRQACAPWQSARRKFGLQNVHKNSPTTQITLLLVTEFARLREKQVRSRLLPRYQKRGPGRRQLPVEGPSRTRDIVENGKLALQRLR